MCSLAGTKRRARNRNDRVPSARSDHHPSRSKRGSTGWIIIAGERAGNSSTAHWSRAAILSGHLNSGLPPHPDLGLKRIEWPLRVMSRSPRMWRRRARRQEASPSQLEGRSGTSSDQAVSEIAAQQQSRPRRDTDYLTATSNRAGAGMHRPDPTPLRPLSAGKTQPRRRGRERICQPVGGIRCSTLIGEPGPPTSEGNALSS